MTDCEASSLLRTVRLRDRIAPMARDTTVTALFGLVHGLVSVVDQGVGVGTVIGIDTDPDTCGQLGVSDASMACHADTTKSANSGTAVPSLAFCTSIITIR